VAGEFGMLGISQIQYSCLVGHGTYYIPLCHIVSCCFNVFSNTKWYVFRYFMSYFGAATIWDGSQWEINTSELRRASMATLSTWSTYHRSDGTKILMRSVCPFYKPNDLLNVHARGMSAGTHVPSVARVDTRRVWVWVQVCTSTQRIYETWVGVPHLP
jgi:hypothetical protein